MPQTRRPPGKMKGTHTKTPQHMPQHSARQVCNTPACLFTNRHTDYHVANKTLRHAARPAVPLIAGSLSSKVFQRYVAAAGLLAYPSGAHLPGIFRPVAFAQNSAARRVVRTDTGHTACGSGNTATGLPGIHTRFPFNRTHGRAAHIARTVAGAKI